MFRSFAALLIAAFALLAPAQTNADSGQTERILSFRSDIEVAADASLQIAETIRVEVTGETIRHGIYREFPTGRVRDGQDVPVGFTIDSVARDGRTEPWHREELDGAVRIRIGDADRDVTPGEHTYVIRYRTTGQLDLSDPESDELYWNVTGNGWRLRIASAEAHVRLPEAAGFGRTDFYTGLLGAREQNAEIISQSPGEVVIRTTRTLAEGEGLTISVTWPKRVLSGR